jgi:hypothetical protein
MVLHQIHSFLPTKIVSFVMNLKQSPRPVYIVRHGESDFNVRGLIGGGSLCSNVSSQNLISCLASRLSVDTEGINVCQSFG